MATKFIDPFDPNLDRRKAKRFWRKVDQGHGSVYMAYVSGEEAATRITKPANPYPKGSRHEAWENGYKQGDPLGDWHGSNV